MAEEIVEMLTEREKQALLSVFKNAKYKLIGQPYTDPTARPFPPLTPAQISAVKKDVYNRVIAILTAHPYALTQTLKDAVKDFASENVDGFVKFAKEARMKGLSEDDKRDYETKRAYQIGDSNTPPANYTGPYAPQWMRKGYKPFKLLSEKTGHRIRTVFFSLILLVVGISISTAIGNMWFMVGFMFWSFYTILPDPEEIKLAESPGASFGSYFTGDDRDMARDNRTNVGVAFLKAVTKVGIIICFIGGLYSYPFPMSNLILLFLAFGFYFSMPVEFEPRKPYDFILSFFRVLLGVFIAVFIFGAFGAGIFQSRELGWLTLAFFVVFPVATEKESLARALGRLGSGSGQSHEMLDKIIFLVIMLIFAFSLGFGFTGGGFFTGTGGIIFSAVWVLGLVAGLTTPAETRPWMGAIILIVGFLVFGLGAGQQAMGVAFFGEWWPTVHNSVTEFMKPVGDMFSQFQQTFGQTWLLFTSPTEFAKQITQGTYARNELGVTGAYGLEINRFNVMPIYIDEPFFIEIDLENKGIYHAKNVRVEILTNIRDFYIGRNIATLKKMENAYKDKYEKQWYKFTIDNANSLGYSLGDIERQDALPIFLVGRMSCEDFNKSAWRDFGVLGGHEHTVREYFIPFVVNVTYEYEADSSLQIDFISTEEWRRLYSENNLVRSQKPSVISTSPANLNLGGMDQPIREDLPFYVGFNLSSTWPDKTLISGGKVNFRLPYDFGKPACIGTPDIPVCFIENFIEKDVYNCTFNLKTESKSSFCSYYTGLATKPINVPKKTYTVSAYATYNFSRWEGKDTQFNFKDVCWPREMAEGAEIVPGPREPGGKQFCKNERDQGRYCDIGNGGCTSSDQCYPESGTNSRRYAINPNNLGEQYGLKCNINVNNGNGACCPEGSSNEQCQAALDAWMRGESAYQALLDAYQ